MLKGFSRSTGEELRKNPRLKDPPFPKEEGDIFRHEKVLRFVQKEGLRDRYQERGVQVEKEEEHGPGGERQGVAEEREEKPRDTQVGQLLKATDQIVPNLF